jgi:hypothetical protein
VLNQDLCPPLAVRAWYASGAHIDEWRAGVVLQHPAGQRGLLLRRTLGGGLCRLLLFALLEHGRRSGEARAGRLSREREALLSRPTRGREASTATDDAPVDEKMRSDFGRDSRARPAAAGTSERPSSLLSAERDPAPSSLGERERKVPSQLPPQTGSSGLISGISWLAACCSAGPQARWPKSFWLAEPGGAP